METHFEFQELGFKKKGFPGKQAFFQGKLNWKPVISVNRQFQDSYFVSVSWKDPAAEHYSRFPYSLSAVRYTNDFQSILEDLSTPFPCVSTKHPDPADGTYYLNPHTFPHCFYFFQALSATDWIRPEEAIQSELVIGSLQGIKRNAFE